MDTVLRVLFVEDSEDDALLLIRKIRQGKFELDWVRVDNEADMRRNLEEKEWDLVISDYSMPTFDGISALRLFKQMALDIPFILVSGTIGEEVAVNAMREGAHDYLMKGNLGRLVPAIRRELRETKIRRERSRALTLLKEREEILTRIIENIPFMIFIKDAKDLRFLRVNKAGEELLGIKRDELIGSTDYDFFPKEEADFLAHRDREVLAEGCLIEIPEETIQTRHKGERILRTKKIPLKDDKGMPAFLFGISEDITEIKQKAIEEQELKKQLRQAQKMESIGTLAGGIAHDFNNILMAVLGYAELAKMQLDNKENLAYSLSQILQAGIRAKNLVDQILTFTRQTDIKREPMAIIPMIKETLKFLRASLPVTIDIQHNLRVTDSTIIADPTQIHQIVMNLFTNAAHAMRENGGILDIRLAEVMLTDEVELSFKELNPGRYLQLTVSDTGCGITKENIDKVFDPFFTTKERGQGTGMGLSVVHGIIKDMGGSIAVISQPGQGTTFKILFPKHEGKPIVSRVAKPKAKTGSGSILIVDDEVLITTSVCGILEKIGYHVVSTTNPLIALDIFKTKANAFDLVLTDMTMPKMTGLELAEKLIQIKPGVPIIMFTGYSPGLTRESLNKAGIKELIAKPFVASELANTVYEVLYPDKK